MNAVVHVATNTGAMVTTAMLSRLPARSAAARTARHAAWQSVHAATARATASTLACCHTPSVATTIHRVAGVRCVTVVSGSAVRTAPPNVCLRVWVWVWVWVCECEFARGPLAR